MDNNITPDAPDPFSTSIEIADDISVENGILKFNSLEDMRGTVLALSQMDKEERFAWEDNLGFTSMDRIYHDIIQEEWVQPEGVHSALYLEKLNSGLIKIDERTGIYILNIHNQGDAPVLNEQGLVAAGNTLYQVAPDATKIWENANLDNVAEILNTTETSEAIEVISVPTGEMDGYRTDYWYDYHRVIQGDTRFYLYGYFYSYPRTDRLIVYCYMQMYVVVNNRIDPGARMALKGSTDGKLYYDYNGFEIERPFAYNYPEMYLTGGHNIFFVDIHGVYYASPPFMFLRKPVLDHARWQAVLGASNGKTATCNLVYGY